MFPWFHATVGKPGFRGISTFLYESLPALKFTFIIIIMVLCSTHTIMAGKKYVFQLIAIKPSLYCDSGKIGKLPALRRERKTKHTQIALLLLQ